MRTSTEGDPQPIEIIMNVCFVRRNNDRIHWVPNKYEVSATDAAADALSFAAFQIYSILNA